MHTPERAPKNHCSSSESRPKTSDVDFSRHERSVRIGVTSTQFAIVRAAVAYEFEKGRWPSSYELSAYADVPAPVLWAELKKLAALGCVVWTRVVTVARMPDGVISTVGAAP